MSRAGWGGVGGPVGPLASRRSLLRGEEGARLGWRRNDKHCSVSLWGSLCRAGPELSPCRRQVGQGWCCGRSGHRLSQD